MVYFAHAIKFQINLFLRKVAIFEYKIQFYAKLISMKMFRIGQLKDEKKITKTIGIFRKF